MATRYRVTVRREGEAVTISKTPGGESIQWAHGDVPRLGRIGFRFGRGRGGILRHSGDTDFMTEIGGPPPPPPNGTFPGDWRVWQRATSGPNRKPVTTPEGLRAAIAAAKSGHQILLPAGGEIKLGGDLIIDRAADGTDAYYIATDTDSADNAALCKLTGGNIYFKTGARRCVINGVRQINNRVYATGGKFCQVERMHVTGLLGDPEKDAYGAKAWFHIPSGGVEDFLVGFVHMEQASASFYDQSNLGQSTRILITHCFLDRTFGGSKFLQPGRNPGDSLHDCESIAQYCLDQGASRSFKAGKDPDWVELKNNGWHVRFNTSHEKLELKIRHGRLGVAGDGGTGPKRGNIIEGNLWVNVSPINNTRGAHHLWLNNWCVKGLAADQSPTKDTGLGAAEIGAWVGRTDAETYPGVKLPSELCLRRINAYRMMCGGNRGFTIVPQYNSSCKPDIKPRAAIATRTGQGRNTSAPDAPLWGSGTDFTTQLAGADIDKVPRRMFVADVGPRAWRKEFADVVG